MEISARPTSVAPPSTASLARAGFVAAIEELADLLSKSGVDLKTSSLISLARLHSMDDESLHILTSEVRLLSRAFDEGSGRYTIKSDKNDGLKAFTRLSKVRIPDDFFNVIGSDDIVELYMMDFGRGVLKQAWRNWKFMSMCSYDLITLMTKSMDELFFREGQIQQVVVTRIRSVFENPVTQRCEIPPHVITEKLDQNNRQFLLNSYYIAPVMTEDGKVVGIAITLDAKPLGSAYARLSNVEPITL